MNTVKTMLVASVLTVTCLAAPLHAQVFPRGNGIELSDKNRFDMYVQIHDWKDMRQEEGEFRLETLRRFEAELKQAGIDRRPANRNYLVCAIQATRAGNQIAYTSSVEYWGLESTGVNVLLWQQSSINMAAANRFTPALIASECAGYVLNEWRKWNTATE